MCGLTGVYDLSGENRIDQEIVVRMTHTLYHRGPDQFNYHIEPNTGFGFSRLSIIDLTGGIQPMINEDASIVSMCNGEIFNHRELRRELQAKGKHFRTECDAEVIPHLYEAHGEDSLDKIDGQFALIVLDKKRRKLFAARDQMGILPFFYTLVDDLFIFGSEIKALLQHPMVEKAVDPLGLDQVLTFPGLISPCTMFRGIRSLAPGHYLTLQPNQEIRTKQYWDLCYPQADQEYPNRSENDYIEEFDEIFTRSVERRLLADVPVGIYLSGGLDSSLVAAKMRRILGKDALIDSFSVTFEDKLISEGKYQRYLAKALRTRHHERLFRTGDIIDRLEKVIYHTESVIKETFNSASMALSQLTHEEDIRVVLAGQGADELFAGYVGYRYDAYRAQGQREAVSPAEQCLRKRLWTDADFMYEKTYSEFEKEKLGLYSAGLREYFSLFNCLDRFVVPPERLDGVCALHKRSYLDVKLRLADHLLSGHGDRMAMSNSVETRYPFIAQEVLDFVTRLPPSLKLHDFREKYLLYQLGDRYLPKPILKRNKFEFTAPGSPFLLAQKNEYIEHLLAPETIRGQAFFDPDEVTRLVKRYSEPGFRIHMPFESDMLIVVIAFGIFMDTFDMPSH